MSKKNNRSSAYCPACAVEFPSSLSSTIPSTPVTSIGRCVGFCPLDIARSRNLSRIPAKLPKDARISVTDALASSIDPALTCDKVWHWLFHLDPFHLDAETRSTSLTATVKSHAKRPTDNRELDIYIPRSFIPRTTYIRPV